MGKSFVKAEVCGTVGSVREKSFTVAVDTWDGKAKKKGSARWVQVVTARLDKKPELAAGDKVLVWGDLGQPKLYEGKLSNEAIFATVIEVLYRKPRDTEDSPEATGDFSDDDFPEDEFAEG